MLFAPASIRRRVHLPVDLLNLLGGCTQGDCKSTSFSIPKDYDVAVLVDNSTTTPKHGRWDEVSLETLSGMISAQVL